jgi:hypothetical protein
VNPPRTLQYPKLGSADNIEDAFREWYRQYINDVRAGKSQRRHKRYGQLSVVSNRITVCLFCVTQDQHINLGSAGPQQMISSSMQQQQHMKKMKKTMVFLCSITWLLLLLLLPVQMQLQQQTRLSAMRPPVLLLPLLLSQLYMQLQHQRCMRTDLHQATLQLVPPTAQNIGISALPNSGVPPWEAGLNNKCLKNCSPSSLAQTDLLHASALPSALTQWTTKLTRMTCAAFCSMFYY